MCCSTKSRLIIGYQIYTAISSLLTSIYSIYAITTSNIKEEYKHSENTHCKNIFYYLLSITGISSIIGVLLTAYLGYKCFCQALFQKNSKLNYTFKRCIYLGSYISINFWGYFVIFLTPKSCFKELNNKILTAFILFNSIFTINLIYIIVLFLHKIFRKHNDQLLNQNHHAVI